MCVCMHAYVHMNIRSCTYWYGCARQVRNVCACMHVYICTFYSEHVYICTYWYGRVKRLRNMCLAHMHTCTRLSGYINPLVSLWLLRAWADGLLHNSATASTCCSASTLSIMTWFKLEYKLDIQYTKQNHPPFAAATTTPPSSSLSKHTLTHTTHTAMAKTGKATARPGTPQRPSAPKGTPGGCAFAPEFWANCASPLMRARSCPQWILREWGSRIICRLVWST
jgi:hypothetical protein